MSVALAKVVPPPRRQQAGGPRPVPLRLVPGATDGLLPLGEVLVPVGRRPVLRLLPSDAVVARPGGSRADGPGPAGRGRHGPAPTAGPATAGPRAGAPGGSPSRPAEVRARRAPAGAARRRRARLARSLVGALLAVGAVLVASRAAVGGGEALVPVAAVTPEVRLVVVERGQTLWSLARELVPGADPRVVIERTRALNGLDDPGLAVGQRLLVPLTH